MTEGVNRFPPVGLIDFSVGDTDGAVVLVVVDVSGAFSSSVPHAAVSPTIATIAVPPTAAAMRRAIRRFDFMMLSLPSPSNEHVISGEPQAIPHVPSLAHGAYTSPVPKWVLVIKTLAHHATRRRNT